MKTKAFLATMGVARRWLPHTANSVIHAFTGIRRVCTYTGRVDYDHARPASACVSVTPLRGGPNPRESEVRGERP
jgi:hypothetical protein